MTIYIKEDSRVYQYIYSFFKDDQEYKEVSFSKESLKEYDNKYKMENYQGHISLKICNSTYHLYYKDIFLGSCSWQMDIVNSIFHILSDFGIERLSFEHKIKKDEFITFGQYICWDIPATNLWYSKIFNEQYKEPSPFTLDKYQGRIQILTFHYNHICLVYNKEVIRSGSKNIHSLRYMSLINFTQDDYIYSDILSKEFNNFQKHIMGSSDELLSQLLQSWKI